MAALRIIFCFLFFIYSEKVFAQHKYSSKNQDYTCVVMQKKNYIGGLGARAGDPMGATLKMYFLKRFGAEAIAGYAMGGINGKFHERTFRQNIDLDNIFYTGHEVISSYGFQSRVVMHHIIPKGVKGLDWYFGVGMQMRIIDAKYTYFQKVTETKLVHTKIKTTDVGPEVMVGSEFAFPKSPFSSFGEVSLFAKVNDEHQFVLPQGGLGIRYNF
ncbi:hypothetical protein BH23BAC1_BH23BAC1_14610 [soil metagenome]